MVLHWATWSLAAPPACSTTHSLKSLWDLCPVRTHTKHFSYCDLSEFQILSCGKGVSRVLLVKWHVKVKNWSAEHCGPSTLQFLCNSLLSKMSWKGEPLSSLPKWVLFFLRWLHHLFDQKFFFNTLEPTVCTSFLRCQHPTERSMNAKLFVHVGIYYSQELSVSGRAGLWWLSLEKLLCYMWSISSFTILDCSGNESCEEHLPEKS